MPAPFPCAPCTTDDLQLPGPTHSCPPGTLGFHWLQAAGEDKDVRKRCQLCPCSFLMLWTGFAEQHPVGWSALVVSQGSNEQPQVSSCCTSTQVELALVSSASAHFTYGMEHLSQVSQW